MDPLFHCAEGVASFASPLIAMEEPPAGFLFFPRITGLSCGYQPEFRDGRPERNRPAERPAVFRKLGTASGGKWS